MVTNDSRLGRQSRVPQSGTHDDEMCSEVTGGDRARSGRMDDVTRRAVRGLAESLPPKSLDTIRAAGAAAEAAMQEHVRRRAYDMWDHAGRPPGNGVAYWVRAEKEVLEEVMTS